MSASDKFNHIFHCANHTLRRIQTMLPGWFRSPLIPFVSRSNVLTLCGIFCLLPCNALAQSTTSMLPELDLNKDYSMNSFRPPLDGIRDSNKSMILPFGYSLFQRQGEIESNTAIQPQYVLRNGDVISLWIWGAFEYQQQHKIDSRGQIFLQQLGPVKVAGISVANLSEYLQRKLTKVYHQGVELYANLYQVAPIPLLVSGAVNSPGQYLGSSGDGILYYLSKAHGIDIREGSFRRLQLRRAGKTVANIDLYPFLQSGDLPALRLQDFDVIFVPQSLVRVTAILPGKIPLSYELIKQPFQGLELLSLLNVPKYIVQVKLISETPSGRVEQTYSMEEFKGLPLNDGDKVFFMDTLNQGALGTDNKPMVGDVLLNGDKHGAS